MALAICALSFVIGICTAAAVWADGCVPELAITIGVEVGLVSLIACVSIDELRRAQSNKRSGR